MSGSSRKRWESSTQIKFVAKIFDILVCSVRIGVQMKMQEKGWHVHPVENTTWVFSRKGYCPGLNKNGIYEGRADTF